MKTIAITGATDGIGRQTALDLAATAAGPLTLVLHGRNEERLAATVERVRAAAPAVTVEQARADFSSLEAVRELARDLSARFPQIDVLLNNAGIYATERKESADGFELTLAVNHLAPVLLTHLLLGALRSAPASRIVNVSSIAHGRGSLDLDDLQLTRGYEGYRAYAQSKLANVLFTVELARRLAPLGDEAPTVNALHPGVVSTKLLQEGFGMEGPDSLDEGAATSVYLAISDEVAGVSGRYFVRRREAKMSPLASDDELCARFYERSCELVGIGGLRR